MPRRRKEAVDIKLQLPDRSGPTEQTLLQLAEERGLFKMTEQHAMKNKSEVSQPSALENGCGGDGEGLISPWADRVLETLLYTSSLTLLHVTMDVIVQQQFSVDRVVWPSVGKRAGQAFSVFALLVYHFHAHSGNPIVFPGLPLRFQDSARQAIFFATSLSAGCYFISITNTFGYLAIMKQAPPIGCLWIWSVIELDLIWAVLSLTVAGLFIWLTGYKIL